MGTQRRTFTTLGGVEVMNVATHKMTAAPLNASASDLGGQGHTKCIAKVVHKSASNLDTASDLAASLNPDFDSSNCWSTDRNNFRFKEPDRSMWYEVGFAAEHIVTGIQLKTCGGSNYKKRVKSFKLLHSMDGNIWNSVESGFEFPGIIWQPRIGQEEMVEITFSTPFTAKYVRINPRKWPKRRGRDEMGLRFQLVTRCAASTSVEHTAKPAQCPLKLKSSSFHKSKADGKLFIPESCPIKYSGSLTQGQPWVRGRKKRPNCLEIDVGSVKTINGFRAKGYIDPKSLDRYGGLTLSVQRLTAGGWKHVRPEQNMGSKHPLLKKGTRFYGNWLAPKYDDSIMGKGKGKGKGSLDQAELGVRTASANRNRHRGRDGRSMLSNMETDAVSGQGSL